MKPLTSCITCGKGLDQKIDDLRHFLLGKNGLTSLKQPNKSLILCNWFVWSCLVSLDDEKSLYEMSSEVTRGERTGH